MNKKDNRLELIRVLSIILVILLHITNRYLLLNKFSNLNTFFLLLINCISRVSVPLFFMISGIVNIPKEFNKKKYYSRISSRILTLIIWTLVYYFIYYNKPGMLLHSLFAYSKPHLWFMYVLIGLNIAAPFISKLVMNLSNDEENLFIKLWLILCGGIYLLKVILSEYGIDTNIIHPIPLINATYYLGYYVVGYLLYKKYNNVKNNNLIFLNIISILCIFINTILSLIFTLKNKSYFSAFYGYSNILIMVPSINTLLFFINNVKDKEYKIINIICPYVFGIYLIHIRFLDVFINLINISNIYLGCVIYLILTFITSYIVIFILKHIPYLKKYIC